MTGMLDGRVAAPRGVPITILREFDSRRLHTIRSPTRSSVKLAQVP
jgi:hypothetical protein